MRLLILLLLFGCAGEPPVSVGPFVPVAVSEYPRCADVTVRWPNLVCEVR